MTQLNHPLAKARDVAIGFFGWAIFSNCVFLLSWALIFALVVISMGQFDFFYLLYFMMWPLTILSILLLKRKFWICVGITSFVVLNAAWWTVRLSGISTRILLEQVGVPLPAGLLF